MIGKEGPTEARGGLARAMAGLVVGCAAVATQSEKSKLAETTKINPPNFMAEALADFNTIGAIAPSSRYLTRAMLQPLSLETAKVAVELGPGTGVMTRALLQALPRDATLLAFEINDRFTRHLRATVNDPRLIVVNAPAEALRKELNRRGYPRVDAILSSLALGLMSNQQRQRILDEASGALSGAGIFTQYQYLHCLQFSDWQLRKFDLERLLEQYFRSVKRKIIWPNLPPAFVFACREAVAAASQSANEAPASR
jgi:phosphatidylethanolamine/phosphatidyl-N-methylethanolamine N-methyltransferase